MLGEISIGSNAFEAEAFSYGLSGALEGVQGHGGITGIEKSLQGGTAGVHAAGHGGLGKSFGLHGLTNLDRDDLFEGLGLAFREEIFFGEEIVEGRSEMFV